LVPKNHYETSNDLPPELIEPLFANARLMARAVEQAMEAEGTFIAINNRISQRVPHLRIHTAPRRKKDGLKGFFWPRNPYKDEAELLKTQKAIQKAVAEIRAEYEAALFSQVQLQLSLNGFLRPLEA
jgi:histidine triad (HIT) family protein